MQTTAPVKTPGNPRYAYRCPSCAQTASGLIDPRLTCQSCGARVYCTVYAEVAPEQAQGLVA